MIALLFLGSLLLAGFVVVGVLFGVLGWVLTLPFRILGAVLQFVGTLIALPFILLALVLGGIGLALGVGALLLPIAPLAAIGLVIWWLFRPRGQQRSNAKVVS